MSCLSASMSGFPESRYIVIKEVDLYEAGRAGLIPMSYLEHLAVIQSAVHKIRRINNKTRLETLTIEKDWPEYQPTLQLLAERALAELNAVEHG